MQRFAASARQRQRCLHRSGIDRNTVHAHLLQRAEQERLLDGEVESAGVWPGGADGDGIALRSPLMKRRVPAGRRLIGLAPFQEPEHVYRRVTRLLADQRRG